MRMGWNENGRTHRTGGRQRDIYDYARWEYGTEEAAEWLLREIQPENGERTPGLLARLRDIFRIGAQGDSHTGPTVRENRSRSRKRNP